MLTFGMFFLMTTAVLGGVWWACKNDVDNNE